MTIQQLGLLAVLVFLVTPAMSANCADIYSHVDDASHLAEQGYNTSKVEDAESYAKESMSASVEAMWAAQDCGCSNTYNATNLAYSFAKKAYWSGNIKDATSFLKRAKSAANDAMSYATDCEHHKNQI